MIVVFPDYTISAFPCHLSSSVLYYSMVIFDNGRFGTLVNIQKKLALLVAGLLCACTFSIPGISGAAAGDTAGAPSLVFDSDPGSDDALALFLMKQRQVVPDLVLATYGNAPEKQTSSNLVLVLGDLELDLPVYHGADRPWKGKKPRYREPGFNGKDGLLGLSDTFRDKNEKNGRKLVQPGSLEEAREKLKQHRHITYVATGPLSTLAALVQDPDIKSRIDHVYILGGQLAAPDPETPGEANFAWDPKAVKIVMESGLDITLFPVELTGTQYIEEEELQNLSRQGTWPEFMDLIRANQAAHAKAGEENAAVLPAIFPVLYQLAPEQFAVEDRRITVDKNGQLQENPQGTLVHAVLGVNPRYQWKALEKSFGQ